MNLATTLGISLAALTVAAYANPQTRVFIRHGGPEISFDANSDGWITRAEAAAVADRMFDDMDVNDDGRLTSDDRPTWRAAEAENRFDLEGENCTQTVEPANAETPRNGRTVERRVTVICRGEDGAEERTERRLTILRGGDALSEEEHARIQQEIERAMREAQRASRDAQDAEREAERLEEVAEQLAEQAERQVHREVVVIDGGNELHMVPSVPSVPGVAPVPPAPMFIMLIANSEEADTNGDSALSRDEFRAQHLRFFDASDANGDGRVRFDHPTPPTPPEPPAAPRRG
jgi:hypothetical protein